MKTEEQKREERAWRLVAEDQTLAVMLPQTTEHSDAITKSAARRHYKGVIKYIAHGQPDWGAYVLVDPQLAKLMASMIVKGVEMNGSVVMPEEPALCSFKSALERQLMTASKHNQLTCVWKIAYVDDQDGVRLYDSNRNYRKPAA